MTHPGESVTSQVLAYAAQYLGPATSAHLKDPHLLREVEEWVADGRSVEDATLGLAFRLARRDRRVAGEFLANLSPDLSGMAQAERLPPHSNDSEDLVQSVLGDTLKEVFELEFISRPALLSYMRQRIKWKATDKKRAALAGTRCDDKRLNREIQEEDKINESPTPLSKMADKDQLDRIARQIFRLSERERTALLRQMRGESLAAIAEALEITPNAVSKVLKRARGKLLTET